jgi:serine/threonine protein kinase
MDFAQGADGQRAQAQIKTKIARYELVEQLGKGGFGVVYRAYDPNTNRHVAVKVARLRTASHGKDPDKVLDEARAAGQLDHPGLVRVFDADKTNEGTAFIVMELMDGGSLRDRMTASQPVPVWESCQIIAQAADAIHHAHKRGFVHRDLKPENILLGEQERTAKIADFGLALHDDIQRKGRVPSAGTVAYMAPEQVRGETDRLDGRTDIWALGVILYEMLTGQRPFRGDPESTRKEILEREPKPPRQINDAIPEEVEQLVLECLRKAPSSRPTTALDVKRRLDLVAVKNDGQKSKWGQKLTITAVLAASSVAAVAAWMALRSGTEPSPDGTGAGHLETLVWHEFDHLDAYDPTLRTDQFWAKCHNGSLFAIAEGPEFPQGFILKTSVTLEDGLGHAGLFWAFRPDLSSDEPGHWRCLVAHIGRRRLNDPFHLRLEAFRIVGDIVQGGGQYASIPLQPPPSSEVTIEIHVTSSHISEIRVGDEIPISKLDLRHDRPSRSWPEPTVGRCGIYAANTYAVFRQTSCLPLQKESTDERSP